MSVDFSRARDGARSQAELAEAQAVCPWEPASRITLEERSALRRRSIERTRLHCKDGSMVEAFFVGEKRAFPWMTLSFTSNDNIYNRFPLDFVNTIMLIDESCMAQSFYCFYSCKSIPRHETGALVVNHPRFISVWLIDLIRSADPIQRRDYTSQFLQHIPTQTYTNVWVPWRWSRLRAAPFFVCVKISAQNILLPLDIQSY